MNNEVIKRRMQRMVLSRLTSDQTEKGGLLIRHPSEGGTYEISNLVISEDTGTVCLYRSGQDIPDQTRKIGADGGIPAFRDSRAENPQEEPAPEISEISARDMYYARGFMRLNGWERIAVLVLREGQDMAGYQVTRQGCTPLWR